MNWTDGGHGASESAVKQPIAIIGMACRFPGGAVDLGAFWSNLISGVDAIVPVPDHRWSQRQFYDAQRGRPGRTRSCWGGLVDGLDQFDPQVFGISPREAARMDPQQRMLLEVAWEAIEDGGQPLERLAGSRTAVFVGISSWDYAYQGMSHEDRAASDAYSNTGASLSIASNRISYCFDLRGPSASVDTACSSALVALHLACRSIWSDGCPLALAGGVNALLTPDSFVAFSQLGMLSPDGRCKAFDARANGFVRGEGAGMILLKPLAQAVADGDRVYAVIRATAVNQDGRTPGLTVPSEEAQQALVRQACRVAGVSPGSIQYVEAHGTGTPVGDPIEARALGQALAEGRTPRRPCVIGSVKTHIGHLEAGAGIASVIKVALAMHHRVIPANLHFERPNPAIDFEQLGLRVPVSNEPWPEEDGVRLAGINGFGYGGTNAHVVLQGAECRAVSVEPPAWEHRAELVPLSARSPRALELLAEALSRQCADPATDVTLSDIAGQAAHRRSHHEFRLAVPASSVQDLATKLAAQASGQQSPSIAVHRVLVGAGAGAGPLPPLAFICSGQGPQWWAMGRQLLDSEPAFRAVIEQCDGVARQLGSWSLIDELLAAEDRSRMTMTAIAQPAIFAIQAGLAAVWRTWGVTPDVLIGHSVGEIAAAHLAGVFSLEDAFRVVYHRGRCMDLASSRGKMLAAGLSEQEALEILAEYSSDHISLAAMNSPHSVTLSGAAEPLEQIAQRLALRQIFHRWLKVEYAFHSPHMNPARDELLRSLHDIRPRPAAIPLVSTVTGDWVHGTELDADYWWRNVRQTVRFAPAVGRLADKYVSVAVELSAHPALAYSVAECYQARGASVNVLASLRRAEAERPTMLRALGELYTLGYPIDWAGVIARPARFIPLPGHPWQRQHCWFETSQSRRTRLAAPVHPLLGVSPGGPLPAWQNRVDLQQFPYLADHRVQGTCVLPAAAFLEMVLAVTRDVPGDHTRCVRRLKLLHPCVLAADDSHWLETRYSPDERCVRIHGRPADDTQGWVLHVAAEIVRHDTDPSANDLSFRFDEVRQRCSEQFTRESCYAFIRRLGLDYGDWFRAVTGGWRRDGEALAIVETPGGESRAGEEYFIHPALLDGCFHAVIAADADFDRRNGGLYLPCEIEQVTLHGPAGQRVWCHARLLSKSPHSLLADLDIRNDDGSLVLQVRGFRSQRVTQGDVEDTIDNLFYRYVWQSQPSVSSSGHILPGTGPSQLSDDVPWLVLADRGGVADRLASRLRSAGERVVVASHGDTFRRTGADSFELDAGERDDMLQVLREVTSDGTRACRGMVHLWNLDAPASADLQSERWEAAMEPGVLSLLNLVQAWDAVASRLSAPLYLVTRGAQSVGALPESVEIAQNPAIGFGRVVVSEYPALRCRLIDLDPADPTAADSLMGELRVADEEDEVALRAGVRYVHRYAPLEEQPLTVPSRADTVPYRLWLDRPGTIEGLAFRTVRSPELGAGEVEIRIMAAGLNFSDVMKSLGLYPGLPEGPLSLGAECAGVVTRVGPGVDEWNTGDEVVAVAPGTFASHVVARAELVAAKPSRLSFEQAATVPIAFLTAAYALNHQARLEAGESVLIHSATGGVGLAAVQLARQIGARILATAGTDEKRGYLRRQGIDAVMDSRSLAFTQQVRAETNGRGVDVVLNSLAGEAIPRGLEVLAPGGRFLEIGKRDIYGNMPVGLDPFRNNLSFCAIDLDQLMRLRPARIGTILRRLMEAFDCGDLSPLPCQTYTANGIRDAFRCMQQGKHIGKIVIAFDDRPAEIVWGDCEPVTFDTEATYLITGGMGGFGLALAQWCVDRGARSLVLMGRRGVPGPTVQQTIDRLRDSGARITTATGDVARSEDVATVLRMVRDELPPLKGVFHAAMVLEDGLLSKLDRQWMLRVMAPKVAGTWNLHCQTSQLALDHFVLFSSLSSVFGHAGQANYASANAFLDGLAHYRRAHGLTCVTVNWGYLADVGYLAERQQLGERLQRQGVNSFTISEALEALERAMQRRAVQVSVMRIDWSLWRGLGVTGHVSPRFAHLVPRSSPGDASSPIGPLSWDVLMNSSEQQRAECVDRMLREKVTRLLGVAAERLDAATPLLDLGLDSLMAVELRNWIESQLRVDLPVVQLMRSPSLNVLTEAICDGLQEAAARLPEAVEAESGVESTRRATGLSPADVERMSSQEVDRWLEALLKEQEDAVRGG